MKKVFYLIAYSFIFLCYQNITAQNYTCTTPTFSYLETQENNQPEQCPLANTDRFVFKTFVHIIRDGNGQGGQDLATVNKHLNFLYRDFSVLGIYFSLEGIDYVDDDKFYNFPVCASNFSDCDDEQLKTGDNLLSSSYSDENRIDMYFLSDAARRVDDSGNPSIIFNAGGKANGIPGDAFYFLDRNFTNTISHEMGHVLSLFHTFHGEFFELTTTSCHDFGYITSDCQCGDYVEDTPPDYETHNPLIIPGLSGCLNNCQYVPTSSGAAGPCPTTRPVNGNNHILTPPLNNIMSYHFDCSNTFTINRSTRQNQRPCIR